MKRTILTAILTTIFLNLPATALSLGQFWSRSYGDANGQVPQSVVTDPSGNAYVTGYFYGSVDFGGGDLTATGADADIFLAKFSSSGAHLWSVRFGDAAEQGAYSVAVDAFDNVFIAGYFQGAVNFGGSLLTSVGNRDVFIAKFNAEGVHQWSKRFGDATEQWCVSVSADTFGRVYATGYFLGSVDFGGGPLNNTGSYQVFLACFDTAGAHQWSKQFGDASDQRGASVAVDAFGSVYATGPFKGTINFGGGNLTSAGNSDIFLAKLSSTGVHQWSMRFGDAADQVTHSVATDHWGCVYLTGGIDGTTDFGGGPLTSAGGYDAFVVKLMGTGDHSWSHIWGDADPQYGTSVSSTSLGDVYVAGDFEGTVDLGGESLTSLGGQDFYLAMLDVSGVHQWSQRYGDASTQNVNGIATDLSDDMVATGFFSGTVNFGGGLLTAAGDYDAFLTKFGASATAVGGSSTLLSISSYPNPFNPGTTVRYTLPSKGRVAIAVYDLRGAHVATLVDREMDAGAHVVEWNGRDDRGSTAGSGVYFARLSHPTGTKSYKMVLLK